MGKGLGEILRKKRKGARLTQAKLAKMLGVTAPTICGWEIGNFAPDRNSSSLKSLAEFLELEEHEILTLCMKKEFSVFRQFNFRQFIRDGFLQELEELLRYFFKEEFLDMSLEEVELLILFRKATLTQKDIAKSFLRDCEKRQDNAS